MIAGSLQTIFGKCAGSEKNTLTSKYNSISYIGISLPIQRYKAKTKLKTGKEIEKLGSVRKFSLERKLSRYCYTFKQISGVEVILTVQMCQKILLQEEASVTSIL